MGRLRVRAHDCREQKHHYECGPGRNRAPQGRHEQKHLLLLRGTCRIQQRREFHSYVLLPQHDVERAYRHRRQGPVRRRRAVQGQLAECDERDGDGRHAGDGRQRDAGRAHLRDAPQPQGRLLPFGRHAHDTRRDSAALQVPVSEGRRRVVQGPPQALLRHGGRARHDPSAASGRHHGRLGSARRRRPLSQCAAKMAAFPVCAARMAAFHTAATERGPPGAAVWPKAGSGVRRCRAGVCRSGRGRPPPARSRC